MGNRWLHSGNELELLHRFRAGDEGAFTTVYHRLYERLYWFGKRFIPVEPEVEDIIAEAYLKVWNKREDFLSIGSIASFLHVAVRNQCFNYLKREQMKTARHHQLERELQETAPGDFSLEDIQSELLHKIIGQIELLPPKMKDIFLLSYQQGFKPAQIAEKMGINVQTVKNQKHAALKILKQALANEPVLLAVLMLLESIADA